MIITVIRKLVPQRGWKVEYFCTVAVSSGSPFSNANTVLCSAPWYWYTRRMSRSSDVPQIKIRNSASRIRPSIRLNMICPFSDGWAFFSSVVASSGRYLYMKIKNPTEIRTFTVAIQPLISNFFFGAASPISCCNSSNCKLAEKRRARKPSAIACPRVMTPRTTGHAIHLCFSESRSSGSLWEESSPEGLRQVMAHA